MVDLHSRAVRKRIAAWREEALIDADTAERLLRREADAPSYFGGVVAAMGALSVGLGVAAVVAANWDALPVGLKLAAHAGLNLLLAWWALRMFDADVDKEGGWGLRGVDPPLIVLSASILAFIAHVGQAFNLQGDLLSPMAAWAALTTPFLLYMGRGAGARWAWTAALAGLTAGFLEQYVDHLSNAHLVGGFFAALTVIAYAGPLYFRGERLGPWGEHLQTLAVIAIVVVTTSAQLGWRLEPSEWRGDVPQMVYADALRTLPIATIGLTAAAFALTGGAPWRRPAALLIIFSPLYAAAPVLVGGFGSAHVEALATCLYWLALAGAAYGAGRIGVYKFAAAIVALRLFGVFAEAFSGLLMTGGGLILSGAALIGLAQATRRLLNRTTQP